LLPEEAEQASVRLLAAIGAAVLLVLAGLAALAATEAAAVARLLGPLLRPRLVLAVRRLPVEHYYMLFVPASSSRRPWRWRPYTMLFATLSSFSFPWPWRPTGEIRGRTKTSRERERW